MPESVALILDWKSMQDRDLVIAKMPVWIAYENLDEADLKRLQASQQIGGGITSFLLKDGETKSEAIGRIIDTLDDHHGENSCDGPYDSLLVFGLPLIEAGLAPCRGLGFSTFEETEFGFIARKM